MTHEGSSATILIVEDDFAIREALTQALEDHGLQVEGASNGQEALDYLRNNAAPRLILLDLMMPVMDGLQFRAEQRRDPALAAIPLIVLSADGGDQEKIAALGAHGYLEKPVRLVTLLEIVEQYCA